MVFKSADAPLEVKPTHHEEYDIHDIGEEHNPERTLYQEDIMTGMRTPYAHRK